jgi:predicted nucleic acid-binding protein
VIYFDASYLVRLYVTDFGAEEVRALALTSSVACSWHGRIELIAALHRGYRENRFPQHSFLGLLERFRNEEAEGAFHWIWPATRFIDRAEEAYRKAPASVFLRAADAMHLACAAENGFREIYSHDRHLLAAAPLFGLRAKNVIA